MRGVSKDGRRRSVAILEARPRGRAPQDDVALFGGRCVHMARTSRP